MWGESQRERNITTTQTLRLTLIRVEVGTCETQQVVALRCGSESANQKGGE